MGPAFQSQAELLDSELGTTAASGLKTLPIQVRNMVTLESNNMVRKRFEQIDANKNALFDKIVESLQVRKYEERSSSNKELVLMQEGASTCNTILQVL